MRDYEGDSFGALEQIWTMLERVWYSPPSCHDVYSDMSIGLDPLCLPAPCNLPTCDTSTR